LRRYVRLALFPFMSSTVIGLLSFSVAAWRLRVFITVGQMKSLQYTCYQLSDPKFIRFYAVRLSILSLDVQ
jgi:hypothetical protein